LLLREPLQTPLSPPPPPQQNAARQRREQRRQHPHCRQAAHRGHCDLSGGVPRRGYHPRRNPLQVGLSGFGLGGRGLIGAWGQGALAFGGRRQRCFQVPRRRPPKAGAPLKTPNPPLNRPPPSPSKSQQAPPNRPPPPPFNTFLVKGLVKPNLDETVAPPPKHTNTNLKMPRSCFLGGGANAGKVYCTGDNKRLQLGQTGNSQVSATKLPLQVGPGRQGAHRGVPRSSAGLRGSGAEATPPHSHATT
jgi:hypothetical protein